MKKRAAIGLPLLIVLCSLIPAEAFDQGRHDDFHAVASGLSAIQKVVSYDALRALTDRTNGDSVFVCGRSSAIGSSGSGTFRFNQESHAADDGGVFLKPTTGKGCWERVIGDREIWAEWYTTPDDGLDDTAALQAWANTAEDYGFVARFYGTYEVDIEKGIELDKAIHIKGVSPQGSILHFNNMTNPISAKQCFYNEPAAAPRSGPHWQTYRRYLIMENFSIEGDWASPKAAMPDEDDRVSLTLLYDIDKLRVHNVRTFGSTLGSIYVNNVRDANITHCHIERGQRDGIRLQNVYTCYIAGNTFVDINDDAIALPKMDNHVEYKENKIVIVNNNLEDSQGIITNGGKTVIIAGNNIVRPIVRAIQVGQNVGWETGHTPSFTVKITNNNITDPFPRINERGTFNTANAKGIIVDCNQLMAKDIVETNFRGSVIAPYPFFYLENVDDTKEPNAGLYNIEISGNTMMRTLAPTANYSNYGFTARNPEGKRLSWTGWYDPQVADNGPCEVGIVFKGAGANFKLKDNLIDGFNTAIRIAPDLAANGVALRNIAVENNILRNFSLQGIHVLGNGFIEINENIIDGDPYHLSAVRKSDGSWKNGANPDNYHSHRGINLDSAASELSVNLARNTFRNVGKPVANHTGDEGFVAVTMKDNLFACEPTVVGYSPRNKGIGQLDFELLSTGSLVVESSDPAAADFKKIIDIPTSPAYAVNKFWDGKWTNEYKAGMSMNAGDFGKPVYLKFDRNGTRVFLYASNALTLSDTTKETHAARGLLLSRKKIVAGDKVVISRGEGLLRDDSISVSIADVGKRIYFAPERGYTTTTPDEKKVNHAVAAGIVDQANPTILSIDFSTGLSLQE